MKIFFALVCLIGCFSLTTNAQQTRHGKSRFQGKPNEQFLQKMNLTEDQKLKAKSINGDYRKQMMDLKKNDAITVKEWKEKRESISKKHRNEMQKILTPEQKNKLISAKNTKKELAVIDAKAKMEKMKIHLGLSNEQSDKLKKERVEIMEKMKSLRENASLTTEQKKSEVKELVKKRKEILNSVLSKDQIEKMKKSKKGHQRRRPSFA
ncbi:MAG: hypothetical protein EPO57_08435 [Chitinophagaceae bacterium]|nr:MAG: hypothetical protein EPO57_08435 [Chitinophagaceae bacterium]